MKKILCFGDSNTYGYNPHDGSRYDSDTRWTGILKKLLKGRYEVEEGGLNNRTCFADNPDGIEQTGYKILPCYMKKNTDILILALGINDLQKFYAVSALDIEKGIENIVLSAKNINPAAKIVIVSPSRINDHVLKGAFSFQFDKNSIKKSALLSGIYKKTAGKYNCGFIDLDKIAVVSDVDGLHYEKKEHEKIAQAIYLYLSLT